MDRPGRTGRPRAAQPDPHVDAARAARRSLRARGLRIQAHAIGDAHGVIGTFLDILGINLTKTKLKNFWPARGPQWDALGRAGNEAYFLLTSDKRPPDVIRFYESPGFKASNDGMKLNI